MEWTSTFLYAKTLISVILSIYTKKSWQSVYKAVKTSQREKWLLTFDLTFDTVAWLVTLWHDFWHFYMALDTLTWLLTFWHGFWHFDMTFDVLTWLLTLWHGFWHFDMAFDSSSSKYTKIICNERWMQMWMKSEYLSLASYYLV